jgi:hypothetical protein
VTLHHFTCSHGAAGIRRDGKVIPHPQPVLRGLELAWFTDLDTPDRAGLGLTSLTLKCDRTEHRFITENSDEFVWWPRAVRILGLQRERRYLEEAPGALPAHWYVASRPVAVAV